jgi:hypothetical protein
MYKVGDIVLIKSCAGDAIPAIHVVLVKKIVRKGEKGRYFDWPGYVGWECRLTKPEEADLLRKKWSIPFKFPDHIETFVFETHIIKKINVSAKRKRVRKSKKKTT